MIVAAISQTNVPRKMVGEYYDGWARARAAMVVSLLRVRKRGTAQPYGYSSLVT
jgi:hypothetical protein